VGFPGREALCDAPAVTRAACIAPAALAVAAPVVGFVSSR
jgi:hypothetical protein